MMSRDSPNLAIVYYIPISTTISVTFTDTHRCQRQSKKITDIPSHPRVITPLIPYFVAHPNYYFALPIRDCDPRARHQAQKQREFFDELQEKSRDENLQRAQQ